MITATKVLKQFVDRLQETNFTIVEDTSSSGGRMKVKGVFQKADVKNGNGRIYPEALWNRVLQDQQIVELLTSRQMLGEVEHPADGQTNLSRVSHIITHLEKQGSEIIGEAEILNTPQGKILQELFRANVKVGISSRGKGTSYTRGGTEYVNENDYILDTFDFVYKPSTPGAYPNVFENLTGPYRQESSMKEKLQELKRLDVRAGDIRRAITNSSPEDLNKFNDELIESEVGVDTLRSQDESLSSYAADVLKNIREAREILVDRLVKTYTETSKEFDSKVDKMVNAEKETTGTGSTTNTVKIETHNHGLVTLLRESRERENFWREHAKALSSSSKNESLVPKAKLEAGVKLATALAEKCNLQQKYGKILAKGLSETESKLEALSGRYEASVKLISGIVERNDKARLVRTVREAIEKNPGLVSFQNILLRCKDVNALNSMIADLEKVASNKEEKKEASKKKASISIKPYIEKEEIPEESKVEENTPIKESELPKTPEDIKENGAGGDEILNAAGIKNKRLTEDTGDRSIDLVHKVLNKKSNWK